MNTNRHALRQFTVISVVSFIVTAITACQPSTPVTIFVTATSAAVASTQSPVGQPTTSNFGPVVAPDLTPLPTFTERPPRTPTRIPITPGGPTSQYGPVVSHNYPATSTLFPTPGASPSITP